jgi:hypothetical protein
MANFRMAVFNLAVKDPALHSAAPDRDGWFLDKVVETGRVYLFRTAVSARAKIPAGRQDIKIKYT